MMGNDLSRARSITLGSFLVNFGIQIYGMLATPSMKDIADANHFAFSPNPWFIAAFFSAQAVLQLAWIWKLFRASPAGYHKLPATTSEHDAASPAPTSIEDDNALQVALRYAPIYTLGNLCIAGWLLFWLHEQFVGAQVLVTINTVSQLLAVALLPPLTPSSTHLMCLTHFVAKTFAGIGVLDVIDNGSVMLRYSAPPSVLVQVLTFILFPVATAVSGPLFGSFLLYDVLALFVGQRTVPGGELWGARLGWTALAMGAVVGLKGYRSSAKHLESREVEI